MWKRTPKNPFRHVELSGLYVRLGLAHPRKKVVFTVIGEAFTEVLINVASLCAVLAVIGGGGSLGQLIAVIAAFVLPAMLLAGVKEYLEQNHLYGRVTVRTVLIGMLN